MEYLSEVSNQATSYILCCECGTQIEANPSNMCVACIRTQVDITEGIPKQGVLYFCRKCERYLQPPATWTTAQLESRELLALCLKRLKGLSKVNLVDAGFIWTEPHSMRIKVKITIQKEVLNGAILQQTFVVEFTINNQMCDDCHRVEAKDFWRALVQVRQKTQHKKTFFYLEQLILKNKAHLNTVNITATHDGIDFYYAQKQNARKLVDFLMCVVPCKYQVTQELVSHDIHSNTYNYKTSFSVEIVPVCKDEVICLPPKLAQSLGSINPLCVCHRVTQSVHIIDPTTLQTAEISANVFWRTPFVSVCVPKHLIEYMVMDVETVPKKDMPQKIPMSHKHLLADVWVARMSDLGVNDKQYHCRTHLGHLLSAGESVLGFDLTNTNVNNNDLDKLRQDRLPDVILVKKLYADKAKRNRRRKWKLRHLTETNVLGTASMEREYTDFLEDLEEDPIVRKNINIYRDNDKVAVDTDDTDDEGAPRISLQEMLDDLHIADDATGGEGTAMME